MKKHQDTKETRIINNNNNNNNNNNRLTFCEQYKKKLLCVISGP